MTPLHVTAATIAFSLLTLLVLLPFEPSLASGVRSVPIKPYLQPLGGVQSLSPAGQDAGPFVLVNTLTGLCIQPKGGLTALATSNRKPSEPAQLLLLQDSCSSNSSHTQFLLTASGQLKHVSSGQCMAPVSPVEVANSSPAVVLKDCNSTQHSKDFNLTQWFLTSGAGLQHKQSGLCLHPEGGTPKPSIHLHLYKGCDQDRLEFMPIPPHQVAASLTPPSEHHLEVKIGRKQTVEPAPLCCTAKTCILRKGRPFRHAFVTLIRSSSYLPALKGLICSLAKSNPHSHLIIIAPESDSERFTATELEYLRNDASVPGLSVEYKIVQNVEMPNYLDPRYHLNWIKLQAWNLTDWDALIMLDADMAVVADLKHLFHLPHHFAVVPYQATQKYNYNSGGFIFLRPCKAVFDHMVELLMKYRGLQYRYAFAEQSFLRWYFFYDAFNLPLQYNANAHWNRDLGSKGTVTGLQPIVIHFVDQKPWKVPESDALFKYANPCLSSFPVSADNQPAASSDDSSIDLQQAAYPDDDDKDEVDSPEQHVKPQHRHARRRKRRRRRQLVRPD